MAAQKDTVVGVFLDEAMAQRAIQMLKSSGVDARMADKSAIQAFKSTGLDDEVIELYESRMSEGNTIVTANAGSKGEDVLGMMLDGGAEYINLHTSGQGQAMSQSSSSRTTQQTMPVAQVAKEYSTRDMSQRQYGRVDENMGRARTAEEIRLQLREETLSATKQATEAGEVEIRKTVHEKQVEVPVTLRHEEVHLERHAVDRPLAPGETIDMQDEVISVPVYAETAQLEKQTRVREEVSIGKTAEEEQKTLSGTTRHEHVEVVQTGDVEVVGDTTSEARTTQTDAQQKKNR